MQKIVCGNCGGKVTLPAGFAKAKIRCEHCGYYADVPPDVRAAVPPDDDNTPPPKSSPTPPPSRRQRDRDEDTPVPPPPPVKVRPRIDPRDTRPEFVVEENTGPPLLEGTQDEDDNPYTVHGTGLKTCPECRNELPLDAAFCVHCGTHLGEHERDRPKKKRRFTVIDESFGEGFKHSTRLVLFAVAQVLNVVFTALALATSSWKIDATAVVTGTLGALMNTLLQAFIVGSYDTLRIQRDDRGRATLSRVRRICFFPLAAAKIPWKKCVGVGRSATHGGSIFAWAVCLYLLCTGCLPGILFWWFVLKPERYNVALADVYGGIEETVFHAQTEEESERVVDVLVEATGLARKGVL